MKFAVCGAGGAGGYFGGRLAEAGQDVAFIARGAHLERIREQGLRVDSIKGDFVIHPARATADPAELEPVDYIILGVKAWQVADVLETLRPLLKPDTAIVPMQNGVETPDLVAKILGKEHALGGFAKIISYVIEPGVIRHEGAEPILVFGELSGEESDRINQLRDAFESAGVGVRVPEDVEASMWEKLAFISSWGGLGAVTRAPLGVIRSVPETRELLRSGLEEVAAVARARGVRVAESYVDDTLTFIDTALPAGGTASMQRDMMAGRPSELDAWSGAVVRLGKEANVPTPVHAFLYGALLPMERRARGKLEF